MLITSSNMNLPILQSEVKTMSSREIAELCGKGHKNVIRDIRNMLDSLDGSLLSHEKMGLHKTVQGFTQWVSGNETKNYLLSSRFFYA